jgi:hypothetical protein
MINNHLESNGLGIDNFLKPGRFDALFKFNRDNHLKIPGDFVESGVYRRISIIALVCLLN